MIPFFIAPFGFFLSRRNCALLKKETLFILAPSDLFIASVFVSVIGSLCISEILIKALDAGKLFLFLLLLPPFYSL